MMRRPKRSTSGAATSEAKRYETDARAAINRAILSSRWTDSFRSVGK